MMDHSANPQFLNLDALNHHPLTTTPFPHLVLSNFIQSERLLELVAAFPHIHHRGSIPHHSIKLNALFQQFINELEGEALRRVIADKFTMNLDDKPTMLTLRGQTTTRDGHIHTDSKDKLLTL